MERRTKLIRPRRECGERRGGARGNRIYSAASKIFFRNETSVHIRACGRAAAVGCPASDQRCHWVSVSCCRGAGARRARAKHGHQSKRGGRCPTLLRRTTWTAAALHSGGFDSVINCIQDECTLWTHHELTIIARSHAWTAEAGASPGWIWTKAHLSTAPRF
jgi:hypothetical protein